MTSAGDPAAAAAAASAGVRFPPPLLHGLALLAGVGLERLAPFFPPLPWMPRLALALLPLAVAVALDAWAIEALRRAGTTLLPWGRAEALVTRGPFARSRNPIYLGYALGHAGLALAMGSWWGLLLLAPAFLLVDRLVVPREERHLAARFGADYEEYRRRVRRWWGRRG